MFSFTVLAYNKRTKNNYFIREEAETYDEALELMKKDPDYKYDINWSTASLYKQEEII